MARQDPYLPPGCSSPDGGIDHEWEQASERLLEEAQTVEVLVTLTKLVPAVKEIQAAAFDEGRREGRMDVMEELEVARQEREAYDHQHSNACYDRHGNRECGSVRHFVQADNFEKGKRYRVIFKLKDQRVRREMTVDYLGKGDQGGPVYYFSGRPEFGTTTLPKEALIEFQAAPGERISAPRQRKEG